jgi:hypothetical protein
MGDTNILIVKIMFKLVYNLCFSILYAVIVILLAQKEELLAIQYSGNQILKSLKEIE